MHDLVPQIEKAHVLKWTTILAAETVDHVMILTPTIQLRSHIRIKDVYNT